MPRSTLMYIPPIQLQVRPGQLQLCVISSPLSPASPTTQPSDAKLTEMIYPLRLNGSVNDPALLTISRCYHVSSSKLYKTQCAVLVTESNCCLQNPSSPPRGFVLRKAIE